MFNLTPAARDRKLKVKLTTGPIGSFAHCGDRVTSSLSPKNSGGQHGNRSLAWKICGAEPHLKIVPIFWD
jgi:hypothetical protein